MSFADEVRASSGRGPGTTCTVAMMLAEIDDAELRAEITAVIGSPAYTSSAIARALKARGFAIAETTMGRHRREACRCSRTT